MQPVFPFVYLRVRTVSSRHFFVCSLQISYHWTCQWHTHCSDHLLDHLVDKFLSVSEGSESLCELMSLDLPSSKWGGKLEWPDEVVDFLEIWSTGDNLVNNVLDACNTKRSEAFSNDWVISKRNSSSIDLSVSSFIHQVRNGGSWWETVSNEWFDHLEHVPCGLVKLDKNSVVELSKSEKLQNFLWLWCKLSDTKYQKIKGG